MMQEDTRISAHYLGERGKRYLAGFDGARFGRLYQTHYFQPYCADDLVLLDFGCADGLFLRHLPARARIGVEANPAARQECRDLCEKSSCAIELHESLATVASESVDVAISNHCLEHVLDPLKDIEHIRRALKPGGIFLLVVPFDDWRSKAHRSWSPGDPNNHLFTWSPLNLGNLLTEAGLSVEFSTIHTGAWSRRFFWIDRVLGRPCFELACYLLGRLQNRREVFCKAVKT
jgi:SAM-dependent methyltransferase